MSAMEDIVENQAAEIIARRFIKDMRVFMERASNIASAADKCAEKGDIDGAVRIMMEFEDPAASAQEMLKALVLLKREYGFDPV